MSTVVGAAVVSPTRVTTAARRCLVGLLFAPLLADTPALAEGIAATDFRGHRIELDKPAERIVCLLESALTGLYMLGAESRLVGISTNIYQESVFPYYAAMDERIRERTLPTPGNWDFVNIESMVALQPDLVILWSGQEESIAALEEKGNPRLRSLYRALCGYSPRNYRSRRTDRHPRTGGRATRHCPRGAGGSAAQDCPCRRRS